MGAIGILTLVIWSRYATKDPQKLAMVSTIITWASPAYMACYQFYRRLSGMSSMVFIKVKNTRSVRGPFVFSGRRGCIPVELPYRP